MSVLYNDAHRSLQDEFDTRRMADRIEELGCSDVIGKDEKAFIESRDMFFLATVDANCSPTVSYKGGSPGFVRVLDEATVMFPSFDGNGMFLSIGNISVSSEIGMLFINFEKPHRLRLQGRAELSREANLLAEYKEAEFVVKIAVRAVFQNCPRYVHRYKKLSSSRYVPREDCKTPFASWKRVDLMQDVLPERDSRKVDTAGGIMPIEEWMDKVKTGDPEA